MVSKNQIKRIKSLHQKKYRNKYKLFVVEGEKGINEFLNSSFELSELYCVEEDLFKVPSNKLILVDHQSLKKISALKTPNKAVALFRIPEARPMMVNEFTLALDDIRDPGNLGTIIRLCDWFGVKQLVCSINTVDCYNPKVVQATMGSLSRININYTNLEEFLKKSSLTIYGAVMEGDNVYEEKLEQKCILVMGNEANGISSSIMKIMGKTLTIPRFGELHQTESLNVATATSILLSEFKRR